jgi:hypothetical protein
LKSDGIRRSAITASDAATLACLVQENTNHFSAFLPAVVQLATAEVAASHLDRGMQAAEGDMLERHNFPPPSAMKCAELWWHWALRSRVTNGELADVVIEYTGSHEGVRNSFAMVGSLGDVRWCASRSYSPLSFHPGMRGRRMPLLTTAAGRAYLAFAPEEEQKVLFDLLRERSDIDAERAKNAHFIRTLLSETRQRGYAINRGEWNDEPKFGGVAAPLKFQDRVLACLNLIFLGRAVKDEIVLNRIGSELLALARIIEQSFVANQQRSA